MLHEPINSQDEREDNAAVAQYGIQMRLFLVYAAVYGTFVAINLFAPVLMETIVLFGMNLAVTYGMGLIIFAIVLALIYNRKCAKIDSEIIEGTNVKVED